MSKLIEESKDENDQATGLNLTATSALNHDQQGSVALQNQDECTNLPFNASKQFNEGFDLKTQDFSTSASLDLDMQNLTLTETGNEIYQENSGSTTNSSSYPAQNNHQTFFNNEYAHQQGFYPEVETKISPSNSSNGSIKNQKVSPISDHQKQTVGNDLNSFLNHQASRSGNDNEGSNTHDQFNYSEFYSDYQKPSSSEVPDFSQGLSPNFTQGFSGKDTLPMGVYNPYNIAVDTNLPYNCVKKISPSAVAAPSAADKAPIFPSRMTPHQQILWQQQRTEEVEREKARLELKEQQYLIDQFTQNNTNNFNNHNNNNNNNNNNNIYISNSSKNNSGNNSVTNESTFTAGLKSYSMSPGGTNYQNSGTADVSKTSVRSAGNTPMNFQTANTPVNSLNSTGSSGYSVPSVTPTVGGNLIGASTPRNNSINYNTNNSMQQQPMANKYYGNDFEYNNNYNNNNNNMNNNIYNNNNNNINSNNATAINSNFNHLSGSYKQQQFSPPPTTYNNNILNNNMNSNINATMPGAPMSNNLYVSTLGAYNTAPSSLPYAPAVPAPLNAYPNSNIMNTGYSYGNNVYGNNSNYGAPLATAGVNNNINSNINNTMNNSYDNNNYNMNFNENNTNSTNFPTANSNTNTNINPLINPVTGLANPIASNQSFNNYLHGAQIMQQQQQQLSQSRQMNIMNQMKGANVKDLKATVYMIQLKTLMKHCVLGPQASKTTTIGDFVIIDADRGEDIGIVVETLSMEDYLAKQRHDKGHMFHPKPSTFNHKHAHEDEDAIGKIIRIASVYERQQLPAKYHDEENIKEYCREIARQNYAQSVMIMEAEYQFDRNKLIIYYDSTVRIDFRELVRDLFSAYKTRIWLKKYNVRHFFPKQYAVMGLATGVQFQPDC